MQSASISPSSLRLPPPLRVPVSFVAVCPVQRDWWFPLGKEGLDRVAAKEQPLPDQLIMDPSREMVHLKTAKAGPCSHNV